MDPEFSHERLHVYQKALVFAVNADEISGRLRKRRRDLSEQLERASASILLNIAEGAGEHSPLEKKRFYRMAKRSATECAGIFDLSKAIGALSEDEFLENRDLLLQIVKMLGALSK